MTMGEELLALANMLDACVEDARRPTPPFGVHVFSEAIQRGMGEPVPPQTLSLCNAIAGISAFLRARAAMEGE